MTMSTPSGEKVTAASIVAWTARPADVLNAGHLDWCERLLDAEERSACGRLRFEQDRHLYIVAHALLRSVLSQFANVAPEAWRFTKGRHGKPEVTCGIGLPEDLRFNLTHTQGLAACIVVRDAEVGIDVESISRVDDPVEVGRTVLSEDELARLSSLPSHRERQEYFAHCWCLKEAYTKGLGVGLTRLFDQLRIEEDAGGHIGIDDDGTTAAGWRFFCARPTEEHVLAVAVARPEVAQLEIRGLIPGAD